MFPPNRNLVTEAFAHRQKAPGKPMPPKAHGKTATPEHLKKAKKHLFHALAAIQGRSAPDPDMMNEANEMGAMESGSEGGQP